jgi:hypothetical protein
MKPTLAYVQAKFNEFNAKIFKGKLSPLPIRIGVSRTRLGGVSFKRRKVGTKTEFYNFKLTISQRFDLPEHEVEDTIIHEMIHHYVAQIDGHPHCDGFSWYGIFGHGTHYRAQVKRLKREFGLNIRIHGGPFYLQGYQPPTTLWGKLLEYISCRLT